MTESDPKTIVLRFNDCINSRDIQGLEQLMTVDHVFIDTLNNEIKGKETCVKSWKGFFVMFPDYQNFFETIVVKGHLVTIIGHSMCMDIRLEGPAIWTAKIHGDKVAEWRVYKDTEENREMLM